MRRGEVWWANLPAPVGRRPVLLLSRDAAYEVRTAVTVAAITRTARRIPVEVPLDVEDGMPEKCVINVDNIMTIPKSLLSERITVLSRDKMALVDRAILFALDIDTGT
ncbi:type II toxin-antitoxin system PemK/MazF family toxin [Dehalococcoidales bacterium]|nr:type II toxin-antitoxin system PemK/MazF family toxin [Dehalococcoidales bacterium]MCL0094651.1 type II toxin-antitoxin system PemK/MazF family toxin [Dehalococcoidales bacterium]